MKTKFLILLTVCISGYVKMFAQSNGITVKFQESPQKAEIAGILAVLDASQVTATLYTDSIDAKYYEIWMIERLGSDSRRKKIGYKKIEPDSTKLTFTALANDSLNATISLIRPNAGVPTLKVQVPTTHHLLIGCDYEWKFNEIDTIPLVGYATGIPRKYELGDGKILEGFYVCGLRFSKVKPYDWKEKYSLSDYLYFEAIPVKEMNYDFQ